MSDLGVPCPASVRVTVTATAEHRCPFRDEMDYGTVEISWTTTSGQTLELHALAGVIRARAGVEISHEQWTADLAEAIAASARVDDLAVISRWTTAGIQVEVAAAPSVHRRGGGVDEPDLRRRIGA